MSSEPSKPTDEEELQLAPQADGTPPSSPPTGNDANIPLQQSLEELEVTVRQRLKKLVDRAKAVQESAQHLLDRGRSLEQVRATGEAMMKRKDTRLEELIAKEKEVSRKRTSGIRETSNAIQESFALRQLLGDVRSEAWADFQNTIAAPAEQWFTLIHSRRTDSRQQVDELKLWLDAAENRWLNGGSPSAPATANTESDLVGKETPPPDSNLSEDGDALA